MPGNLLQLLWITASSTRSDSTDAGSKLIARSTFVCASEWQALCVQQFASLFHSHPPDFVAVQHLADKRILSLDWQSQILSNFGKPASIALVGTFVLLRLCRLRRRTCLLMADVLQWSLRCSLARHCLVSVPVPPCSQYLTNRILWSSNCRGGLKVCDVRHQFTGQKPESRCACDRLLIVHWLENASCLQG